MYILSTLLGENNTTLDKIPFSIDKFQQCYTMKSRQNTMIVVERRKKEVEIMNGLELLTARKKKGLTQLRLSMVLPISRESISKYERGRQIPDDIAEMFKEVLSSRKIGY